MTILVTGARGTVGRRVVDLLVQAGLAVRAGSRDPVAAGRPSGVSVVAADLAKPDTLGPALDGVDKVFLYADPSGIEGFVDRAHQAGVGHVVLLSSAAAGQGDDSFIARRHTIVEDALRDSALPWTFLRPGAFATNALQWAPAIRAGGVVRGPFPRAHAVPIHEDDIAEVAVAALTGSGHEGRTWSLSGPESLTQQRQVELIGEALSRPLRFEEIGEDEARRQMTARVPEAVADALLAMQRASVDRAQPVATGVPEALGRPARSFATWAADHASDFTD
jgi:uncharacterized protein YbjT (DUF2867 family)